MDTPQSQTGHERADGGTAQPTVARRWSVQLLALMIAAFAAGVAGCGLGTYGDTGSAEPGPWWPWVCADGGEAVPDGGCPPPPCSDAAPGACTPDGGAGGAP